MKGKLALAGAALLAFAGAAHGATPPAVGTYNTETYILSQSDTGCTDFPAVGSVSYGTLTYPGPSATGMVQYQSDNDSGNFSIDVITYPKTPAAGVKTWKGAYKYTFKPSGTFIKGTVKATFTFIDAAHFLLLLVATADSCTETIQITAWTS